MKIKLELNDHSYEVDLNQSTSLAIPFNTNSEQVNAWYVEPIKKEPFQMGDWIGSVKAGASVNFNNLTLNPHGNGTHTECLGHITLENESIKDITINPFEHAQIISIDPIKEGNDLIITKKLLESKIDTSITGALILRTLPNETGKLTKQYTETNPPYLTEEVALWICELKISHLLIDLPSVDKESDEGKLLAHHAFWGFHLDKRRTNATISELIYVPDQLKDGEYLLNLQVLPFENDASPSNPLVFKLNRL